MHNFSRDVELHDLIPNGRMVRFRFAWDSMNIFQQAYQKGTIYRLLNQSLGDNLI